ncbi:MAG: response regulator [Selenomonadaceae bacterium]|nr:response regulator [Selenomonadaceae bacterium]
MKNLMPLDTSVYDDLPVTIFIYKAVLDSDSVICDYRIVYGNKEFIKQWKKYHGSSIFLGASIIAHKVLNDKAVDMMRRFFDEEPYAFSTFLHDKNLHVHLQPIVNLKKPFGGFFMTNVTEYEEESSRMHFLQSIRQMKTAGVLLREKIDGGYECVFASKEFAKLMECTEEEAVRMMSGKGYLWTTHVDDRLAVKRMIRRKVSEEEKNFLTIRKITAKNNEIWCKIYFSFIEDFRESYIYATYFDVTNSRVYAERLRTTYMSMGNNFYRENDRTLGMFRVNLTKNRIEDLKGRDLFATDSIMRPYSEIIRLRAVSYIIGEEKEYFLRQLSIENLTRKYLTGQNQLSFFLLSRRKTMRLCYVNYIVALTRHPITGEIIAFISEQEADNEKVENLLIDKILARQFDMVSYLSEGNYGVVVGDAARITKGNIFPLTLKGRYTEYLKNQVIPVLHGDEESKKAMIDSLKLETVQKKIFEKEPYVVNITCKIDGEVYYKRFDFFSVDPRANFFVILKSDTTEIQRKQIEQNKRLKETLEESKQANKAKTAFMSRISHEIRTPMNAIIGLNTIAMHEKDLSDNMKNYLEKMRTSANCLLSLINDILDMNRIESGRTTIRNAEFSFKDFVEQIESLVQTQCREKNLKFSSIMSGSIKNFYIGDDMKLKQVLMNVLSNSVKFTEPGGEISLTVECISQFENNSAFKFTVKDTGIGMEKSYLPKIFEPFSQEDAANTSKYGGSGLGLAITKNIIDIMNGSISVDSEKGVGTTFTITIPLKHSDRVEEKIYPENFRPQDFSVLVIDDDPISCDHAKIVLAEEGISADICVNGDEALNMIRLRHARRDEYNLILIDLRMPHRNGIELTREIRKIIGKDPTVIMLTRYDWFEVEQEALEAGVDDFIAKPLTVSNLLYGFQQVTLRKKQNAKPAEPVSLEGRKILVVEDMAVNAEIIMMLLEMQGMISEHAENGQIAVDMFKEKPPGYYSAVLMDIRMPVMDGLKATETIRALDRDDAKTIPILAMTANAFDEDVQRSLQAGMNAHLAKPVDPELLFKSLQEFIKN